MKTVDIKVGDVYAIVSSAQDGEPFNTTNRRWNRSNGRRARPTKTEVHEGIEAAPARVLAIGKFRKRRVGSCDWEIVNDHYMTTVKVAVVDVVATLGLPMIVGRMSINRKELPTGDGRIGYRDGLPLKSKKIVWKEEVVNAADVVMPWDAFILRAEERSMAVFERKAQLARLEELDGQIKALAFKLVENGGLMSDPASVSMKVEMVVEYGNGGTKYTGVKRTQSRTFPIDGIPQLQPLLSEYDELVRRLNCS
jgi:hypothetical protein